MTPTYKQTLELVEQLSQEELVLLQQELENMTANEEDDAWMIPYVEAAEKEGALHGFKEMKEDFWQNLRARYES